MTAAARARHGARDKYELQQQATPIPAQQDLRAFRQSLILTPPPTEIGLMAWKRDDEQRACSTRRHEGASDHEALHAHSSGIACCALESPCSLTTRSPTRRQRRVVRRLSATFGTTALRAPSADDAHTVIQERSQSPPCATDRELCCVLSVGFQGSRAQRLGHGRAEPHGRTGAATPSPHGQAMGDGRALPVHEQLDEGPTRPMFWPGAQAFSHQQRVRPRSRSKAAQALGRQRDRTAGGSTWAHLRH